MAGLSEMCSHVGALLFWVEFTVRKREEKSCTSGPNQWLEPTSVKKVPYLELINTDFTSARKTYQNYTQRSVGKVPAEDKPEPVVDESEPILDESELVVDESGPVVDESELVVDESGPVVDESELVVDNPKQPLEFAEN